MRVYSHIYIYNTLDRCEGVQSYTYITHRIGVRVYSHIYIYNTQTYLVHYEWSTGATVDS